MIGCILICFYWQANPISTQNCLLQFFFCCCFAEANLCFGFRGQSHWTKIAFDFLCLYRSWRKGHWRDLEWRNKTSSREILLQQSTRMYVRKLIVTMIKFSLICRIALRPELSSLWCYERLAKRIGKSRRKSKEWLWTCALAIQILQFTTPLPADTHVTGQPGQQESLPR